MAVAVAVAVAVVAARVAAAAVAPARVAVAEEAAARAAAVAEVAMDVVKGTAAVGRARREILQVEVDQTTHRPSEPLCVADPRRAAGATRRRSGTPPPHTL